MSALQQKEETLRIQEKKARELEEGREASVVEGRRLQERLSLLEKSLEGEKGDLAKRKVILLPGLLEVCLICASIVGSYAVQ